MSKDYKIYLLKSGEFLQSEGEGNVIKEIDYIPAVSSNLEIDGETYHVVSTYGKGGMIGVRPFQYNDEVEDDLEEDNLTCPYCSYEDFDAFELPDEGETSCGRCGSEMEYERVLEIRYTSTPKKKKEAIKV